MKQHRVWQSKNAEPQPFSRYMNDLNVFSRMTVTLELTGFAALDKPATHSSSFCLFEHRSSR